MLAVSKNQNKIVDYLITRGASVSRRNKDGWTPLHIASRYEGILFDY